MADTGDDTMGLVIMQWDWLDGTACLDDEVGDGCGDYVILE